MKIKQIKPNIKRFIELRAIVLIIVIVLLLSLGQAPVNNSASTTGDTKTSTDKKNRLKNEIRKRMTKKFYYRKLKTKHVL